LETKAGVNKLFIIWPFHCWPEARDQKNTSSQWVEDLSPRYSQVTLVSDNLFDSCQLTMTWMFIMMSTIKLNTVCVCLGHLASNARSLQENSQSEHAYYCSHMIKSKKRDNNLRTIKAHSLKINSSVKKGIKKSIQLNVLFRSNVRK